MRLEQIIAELEAPIKEIKAYDEERRRSGNKYSRSLWDGLKYPESESESDSDSDSALFRIISTLKRRLKREPEPVPPKRRPIYLDVLCDMLNQHHMTNAEFYKKAHIDRRHFSKILNNYDYCLSRNTVFLMCLAIELNMQQMRNFLPLLGYSYSTDIETDIIVGYFIENKIYDIDLCNEVLIKFGLRPLENLPE